MGENDIHQVKCPEWDRCPAKGKCPKGFDRINGCHQSVETQEEKGMIDLKETPSSPPAPDSVAQPTPKEHLQQCFFVLCRQYEYIGKLISLMAKLLAVRKPSRENMLKALQRMAEQYKEIGEQLKTIGVLVDSK